MKSQALFSSKDKSKKLKCRLLQFLFGTLRLNLYFLNLYESVGLQKHVTAYRNEALLTFLHIRWSFAHHD